MSDATVIADLRARNATLLEDVQRLQEARQRLQGEVLDRERRSREIARTLVATELDVVRLVALIDPCPDDSARPCTRPLHVAARAARGRIEARGGYVAPVATLLPLQAGERAITAGQVLAEHEEPAGTHWRLRRDPARLVRLEWITEPSRERGWCWTYACPVTDVQLLAAPSPAVAFGVLVAAVRRYRAGGTS